MEYLGSHDSDVQTYAVGLLSQLSSRLNPGQLTRLMYYITHPKYEIRAYIKGILARRWACVHDTLTEQVKIWLSDERAYVRAIVCNLAQDAIGVVDDDIKSTVLNLIHDDSAEVRKAVMRVMLDWKTLISHDQLDAVIECDDAPLEVWEDAIEVVIKLIDKLTNQQMLNLVKHLESPVPHTSWKAAPYLFRMANAPASFVQMIRERLVIVGTEDTKGNIRMLTIVAACIAEQLPFEERDQIMQAIMKAGGRACNLIIARSGLAWYISDRIYHNILRALDKSSHTQKQTIAWGMAQEAPTRLSSDEINIVSQYLDDPKWGDKAQDVLRTCYEAGMALPTSSMVREINKSTP